MLSVVVVVVVVVGVVVVVVVVIVVVVVVIVVVVVVAEVVVAVAVDVEVIRLVVVVGVGRGVVFGLNSSIVVQAIAVEANTTAAKVTLTNSGKKSFDGFRWQSKLPRRYPRQNFSADTILF